MNFIKKIAEKNVDEFVHSFFTRYSLGEYEKAPLVITMMQKKIQLKGGFEYVNAFHAFLAELAEGDLELKGSIVTSKDINDQFKEWGIELVSAEKMRAKRTFQYVLDTMVSLDTYKKLIAGLFDCFLLFKVEDSAGRRLKTKKDKPPKIGSDKPGFVILELLKQDFEKVNSEFMFDVPEAANARKISITHTYVINGIEIPKEFENDPMLARLKAIRKGEILRKVEFDEKVKKLIIPMEV